jgi:hypothetical protein
MSTEDDIRFNLASPREVFDKLIPHRWCSEHLLCPIKLQKKNKNLENNKEEMYFLLGRPEIMKEISEFLGSKFIGNDIHLITISPDVARFLIDFRFADKELLNAAFNEITEHADSPMIAGTDLEKSVVSVSGKNMATLLTGTSLDFQVDLTSFVDKYNYLLSQKRTEAVDRHSRSNAKAIEEGLEDMMIGESPIESKDVHGLVSRFLAKHQTSLQATIASATTTSKQTLPLAASNRQNAPCLTQFTLRMFEGYSQTVQQAGLYDWEDTYEMSIIDPREYAMKGHYSRKYGVFFFANDTRSGGVYFKKYHVALIEQITEETKVSVMKKLGTSVAAGLTFGILSGGLGLLAAGAGLLAGGRKNVITFLLQLHDGTSLIAQATPTNYTQIRISL